MEEIVIPIQTNLGSVPLDIGAYFSNIVGIILLAAAAAAFIYLILGGIQWITAGGDKAKIEHARDRVTNAIIGMAIVGLSWAIFLLLDHFFGLGVAGGSSATSSAGSGVCACGNGGCASIGTIGSMNYDGTDCYRCTTGGWTKDGAPSTCGVITCGTCP